MFPLPLLCTQIHRKHILLPQNAFLGIFPATMRDPESKIVTAGEMQQQRERLRADGMILVFTNGCFDILHSGHAGYLDFARRQGDALAVGLNSDESVRRNKNSSRPINPQDSRAAVLAALECVDYIIIFDEDEPEALIEKIAPDVLVKGEDWAHYVSGRETVEQNGGKVVLAPLVEGQSTTGIIRKIKELP